MTNRLLFVNLERCFGVVYRPGLGFSVSIFYRKTNQQERIKLSCLTLTALNCRHRRRTMDGPTVLTNSTHYPRFRIRTWNEREREKGKNCGFIIRHTSSQQMVELKHTTDYFS